MKGYWKLMKDGTENYSRIVEVDGGTAVSGFIPDGCIPEAIVNAHNKAIYEATGRK